MVSPPIRRNLDSILIALVPSMMSYAFRKRGLNQRLNSILDLQAITIKRDRLDRPGGRLITLVSVALDYSELSVSADTECIFLKIKTDNGYVNIANVFLSVT